MSEQRVLIMVGTPKGAFILEGDDARDAWQIRGPLCEGWPVRDISADADGALYAAAGSPWFGPAVFRSDDLGTTWSHSSEGLTYGDDGPPVKAVWSVRAGLDGIYAGVEPAGLFRSTDRGQTWTHVRGLTEHPSRPEWVAGNGGLILHTIVPHPSDPARMWVGISSVGVFETCDGGATWHTRNAGVRAEFNPENRFPEYGLCVHKLAIAAGSGERLFQQNHCGVYRSDDGGDTWLDLTPNGLPGDFGFAAGAHPRNPDAFWTIPLTEPEDGRMMHGGAAAVWRTTDAGATWSREAAGLPQEHAYVGVLREAMAVDRLDPVGVYFGTTTGQLYASADEGVTWRRIWDNLPPIWSVEAVIVA
jgi:photosystem II stability/assembly factor-like uncharacterized protein